MSGKDYCDWQKELRPRKRWPKVQTVDHRKKRQDPPAYLRADLPIHAKNRARMGP